MIEPLSAWSSAKTHRALGHTTDKTARLAIALGSIRSVIRVIDRTTPALSVDWAKVSDAGGPVRSMSYTDLRGGHIRINPLPISDGRIDHGRALDVCIGFACHEASHSQESRNRFEHLLKKVSAGSGASKEVPAFEPMRVAAYLWNIVEDVRIEQVTISDWPGFEPYFDAVLAYMWDELLIHHELPTEYGPTLADKMRVVFLACRYPTRVVTPFGGEREWWMAWQADYLTGRVDTPTTIQRGLDHLAEDAETKAEMAEMAAQEQKERDRNEKVRAQLERLMREGIAGTYDACVFDDADMLPLDAETADAVDKLVREGLIEHKTIIKTTGAATPPIRVSRPEATMSSIAAYIGKPDPVVGAMRTALVFRNSAPQHDVKLLKSGTIDDQELYRWGMDDYRVFSDRVIEAKPDVFMGLLVDLSGSMSGTKLRIAQQLAQIFVHAVWDQEGIETAVWGHTGDYGAIASEVYRIWEKGDPLTRLGLISTLPHSNNYDGAALSIVAKEVSKKEQEQKVVIVLSDGLPAGSGYGGKPAAVHVRTVVKWAASIGVTVWQIAIDPYGIVPEDQEKMYPGSWIPFTDAASLPRQLTSLMSRYL